MLRKTLLFAVLAVLVVPAAAEAARPGVTTGGVSARTFNGATLNGRVDANRAATTFFFQYGTTRFSLTNTATAPAGAGRNPRAVSMPIGGLAPVTRYHYRLVAQNADGNTIGGWRTFTTRRQPLGVTLTATPNPVFPGGATTLSGQLTGTNNVGRDVLLEANPFPYTQGFVNTGNAHITDAQGGFSFPILSVPVNTLYRVRLAQRPEIASPIVVVGAQLRVKTDTRKVDRHRDSVSVRFRGGVLPQNDGGRVSIQKFRDGTWQEIAHTRAREAGSSKSKFRTRVRIHRSGRFRAVAESDGRYVPGAGRVIRIRVRR